MTPRITTAIIFMFLCTIVFAQNTLNIHQKDGTLVSYTFAEKPVMTYTNTSIHLKTVDVEMDYPMVNIERFTFSYEKTSVIETVKIEKTRNDVCIYDINGMLIRKIERSDGTASFSIADLPKGIYIIMNGIATYKIVKR